jgi:hypothetical protein
VGAQALASVLYLAPAHRLRIDEGHADLSGDRRRDFSKLRLVLRLCREKLRKPLIDNRGSLASAYGPIQDKGH